MPERLVTETVLDAFRRHAAHPALADGATRLDYAALAERTRRLAAALAAMGLRPGDRVAVLSTNSFRYLEAFLGAPQAGLAIAPVNPRLAPPEVAFIVGDAGAKALLVAPACLPLWRAARAAMEAAGAPIPPAIVMAAEAAEGLPAYEAWIAAADPAALAPHAWRPEEMLLLCYTGGTTGRPKGVMLSAENVSANARHAIEMHGLNGEDVWLHAAPMFHLADSWACHALSSLGARHVFLETFDAGRALALIQTHRVTATSIVPTMILRLLDHPGQEAFDLSSLRRISYGASPMPVERLEEAWRRFGPILQQCYGLSETAPYLTTIPPEDVAPERPGGPLRHAASCGRALPDVSLRIADAEGRDCPPGEVGEILARGPNVMRGYWNRPEETAAAMAGGWLHTGDLATMDAEGFVTVVDRAKDVIISGGENVYSSEVENALYRHPGVQEAAAIGVPDPKWGEAVMAVVVPRPGAELTAEEIIAHCRGLIAAYKCPKRVEFRESLPKSGAGKILKTELRTPYWKGETRRVH